MNPNNFISFIVVVQGMVQSRHSTWHEAMSYATEKVESGVFSACEIFERKALVKTSVHVELFDSSK